MNAFPGPPNEPPGTEYPPPNRVVWQTLPRQSHGHSCHQGPGSGPGQAQPQHAVAGNAGLRPHGFRVFYLGTEVLEESGE